MECQHFSEKDFHDFRSSFDFPMNHLKYMLKHVLRQFARVLLKVREQLLATWQEIWTNLELGTKLTARTGRTARAQGRRARAAAAARACA